MFILRFDYYLILVKIQLKSIMDNVPKNGILLILIYYKINIKQNDGTINKNACKTKKTISEIKT